MASYIACGGIGRGRPVQAISTAPGGMANDNGVSNSFGNAQGGNNFSGPGFDSGRGGDFGGGGGNSGNSNGCRKCGEIGHFARECPNSGGGGRKRACFKCMSEEHVARDCPNDNTNSGSAGGFGGGGSRGQNGFQNGDGGNVGGGGFGGDGGGGGWGGGRGFGGGASNDTNQGFGGGFGGGRNEDSGFGSGGFGSGGFGGGGRSDGDNDSRPRRGGGGGGRGCFNCGQDGHQARECPEPRQERPRRDDNRGCFNCGQQGHESRECTEPRRERNTDGQPMKCYRCQQEGHRAAECTNEPAEGTLDRKPPSSHIPQEMSVDALWQEHIPAGINFDRYWDIPVQVTGGSVGDDKITSFEDANLLPQFLSNIIKAGFTKPTPIQQYAMPFILGGRDLMGCAQTGSGKTAAYILPILNAMMKSEALLVTTPGERQSPLCIVMVPTRELAIQIKDEAKKFAAGTPIKVVVAYGGMQVNHQLQLIDAGCNILVATPGRLLDIVRKGRIGLGKCKFLVLDEADRMLEMGFEAEVRNLVGDNEMPPKTERQTLMFSATFPDEIQTMSAEFLNEHVFITVGKIGAANTDIRQEMLQVDQYSKKDKLVELITSDMAEFKNEDGTYSKKTLVFVERKRVADYVASYLCQDGVPATSIHGDREQRERETALADFKSGKCPVLVATAVAARGLDIKGVDHVINHDLPQSIEDYVHRIGRTGRVGNPGRATSFYDTETDKALSSELLKILTDAQQVVPQWFLDEVGLGGSGNAENTAGDSDFATAGTTDPSADW